MTIANSLVFGCTILGPLLSSPVYKLCRKQLVRANCCKLAYPWIIIAIVLVDISSVALNFAGIIISFPLELVLTFTFGLLLAKVISYPILFLIGILKSVLKCMSTKSNKIENLNEQIRSLIALYEEMKVACGKVLLYLFTMITICITYEAYFLSTVFKGCHSSVDTIEEQLIYYITTILLLIPQVLILVYLGITLDDCYTSVKSSKTIVR